MIELPRPERWEADAECTGTAPNIFFPDKGGNVADHWEAARSYCERCPVSVECLGAAFRHEAAEVGGRHGMRGGLTPDERHYLADTGDARRRNLGAASLHRRLTFPELDVLVDQLDAIGAVEAAA